LYWSTAPHYTKHPQPGVSDEFSRNRDCTEHLQDENANSKPTGGPAFTVQDTSSGEGCDVFDFTDEPEVVEKFVPLDRQTKPYRGPGKAVPEDRSEEVGGLVSGAFLVKQVTMEDVGPDLEMQDPHSSSYVTELEDEYQVREVHVVWIVDRSQLLCVLFQPPCLSPAQFSEADTMMEQVASIFLFNLSYCCRI
jgi:hypothetical protein